MTLKDEYRHFADGLTLLACDDCKRSSYWTKAALAFRLLKCFWCKGEKMRRVKAEL